MTKTTKYKASQPFHLLIPAAGNAARMGLDIPKPFIKINGKSILRYTIEKFMDFRGLQSVSIVINEAHLDLYHKAVKGLDNCHCTIGSSSRKSSIYNGLNNISNVINEAVVLIHDAARPMVQCADIMTLLDAIEKTDAATLAHPVYDTLIKDNHPIDRDNMWAIQTPQAFKFGALKAAHEKFKDDDSFTDDAGLMRAAGHKVEIIPASRQNIKITTPDDLEMVKRMMSDDYEICTASGYDVHAFEKQPSSRQLMLGGIEVAHELALAGHSDADVVLHAVTDSLLGAINEGDIGTHFPPSDMKWKDVGSAVFLKEAVNMLEQRGGNIQFIDVTIMAEAPKIGPHRSSMQERIADIMGVSPAKVSIKATTTEGLGFTGRKEGIAAQALATVRLPVTD